MSLLAPSGKDKLTICASGSAPRLTLDLTMIGSHSVVDQAPRGGPPVICPILNEDAGNLLLRRTLCNAVFVRMYTLKG